MRKIIFLFILSFCVFTQGVKDDEDERKLGDECDYHEECENIENANCSEDEICDCLEEYVPSRNNTNCLPLAIKIGDACEIQEQCSSITGAECISKACRVPQDASTLPPTTTTTTRTTTTTTTITTAPTTIKSKAECTEDSQCSTLLLKRVCKNGTCVLDLPPIAPKNIPLDVFILGKPCLNNTECSAEGAACIDKLCKCLENFVPSQNLKMCLPKAKSVGDKCVETSQCLALNGSVCENEKCSQKISRMFNTDKILPLLIGSACQTDNECKHLTHAFCFENVCQCREGYVTSITSNKCLEKAKKEGDSCEIDKQCEDIKGATCLQKKCVKPGIVGTKLGKENSGSTLAVPKFILGAILLKFFV